LSLPIPLRYRIAYDRELCSEVLGVFLRTVFGSLRRRAKEELGVTDGQSGSVSTLQRFGGAINLNLHVHSLILDGVYADPENTVPRPLDRLSPCRGTNIHGRAAGAISRARQRQCGVRRETAGALPPQEPVPLPRQRVEGRE